MSRIIVNRAEEPALPACFALLPMLAAPETIVFAARDADGTLAGAAGLLWRSWRDPPGMPVWIHVLPDRRRRGVGGALMTALAGVAAGGLDLLWAARPLAEDSDGAAFARARGFVVDHRQLFFEADSRKMLEYGLGIVARLERNGLPAGARIVGLGDAPLDDVVRLVTQEFHAAPPQLAEMIRHAMIEDPATAPIDRGGSYVLLVDDAPAGALLSRRTADGAAQVICNVVSPKWRGGWANAALVVAFDRAAVAAGCFRVRFDCGENVRDTIGLARRGGATLVRTESLLRYALASPR